MRTTIFGLGIIGSIWAKHWRADGHEGRVWNRTPRPDFPGFVEDAAAAAAGSDLLAIVVADGAAVSAVLDLVAPALGPGMVVAQHSTVSPEDARGFARRVEASGAAYLDMPFSGSRFGAEKRQSNFYVGGSPAVLERVAPVYRKIARSIQHIGAVGDAMALKLALNVLAAGLGQSLCEAVRLAEVAGVTRGTFFEALDTHFAKSAYTDAKRPLLEKDEYAPQFSVKLMRKDLILAQRLAAEKGLELGQTEALIETYRRASGAGLDELDLVSLVRLLETE